MKKVILLFLIIVSCYSFSALSISISTNSTAIGVLSYGSIAPGENEWNAHGNSYPHTLVDFTADTGSPMTFSIDASAFAGPAPLALSNMEYHIVYADRKSPYIDLSSTVGTSRVAFTGLNQILYTVTPPANNTAYYFDFIWHLKIPADQQAGAYSSTITLTLTQ
ncbi:MAG: hypothetical protein A2Y40_01880 [Candidatus Margulisbacteria bacterium GWF2_35_9]|nr:MAG: hypothetical protein A2Y40_01880 [Candidatus Margulisbacteria bacterium GWF2_35_9]